MKFIFKFLLMFFSVGLSTGNMISYCQIWERQYGGNLNILSYNLLEDYDNSLFSE
jgi:hypothetical protein